jgi:hypothetical protein
MSMQVVRPTRAEDKVWDAVQEAVAEGWTAKRFLAEARDAWADALKDAAKSDDDDFRRGGA